MNLVDSSGWLEYLSQGKNAHKFERPIEDVGRLIVPVGCLYEVFKRVLQAFDEQKAIEVMGIMHLGKVIAIDDQIALLAASLSVKHHLPMADSLILATAQTHHAVIWSQDADFKQIPGVKYFEKA